MRAIYLLVLLAVAGCKSTKSGVKVVNGKEIVSSKFPSVVLINYGCSSTFIAPDLLITAAHCVKGQGPADMMGIVAASSKVTSDEIDNPIASSFSLANPLDLLATSFDLALIQFPSALSENISKIREQGASPGDEIEIVGFGQNNPDMNFGFGKKRWGSNVLVTVAGGTLQFVGAMKDDSDSSSRGENVSNAPGDSGGPLFIKGELAGITSGSLKETDHRRSVYVDLNSPDSKRFLLYAQRMGIAVPVSSSFFAGVETDPFGIYADQNGCKFLARTYTDYFGGGQKVIDLTPTDTSCSNTQTFRCSDSQCVSASNTTISQFTPNGFVISGKEYRLTSSQGRGATTEAGEEGDLEKLPTGLYTASHPCVFHVNPSYGSNGKLERMKVYFCYQGAINSNTQSFDYQCSDGKCVEPSGTKIENVAEKSFDFLSSGTTIRYQYKNP
jgi:hypothetical protein